MMCSHTVDVETRALVEQTKTLGTVLSSEKIREGTGKRARHNLDLVTSQGGVVAAGELCVVTASSFGFLDCDVVVDGPERILLGAVASFSSLGAGANVGQSNCRGSESKDNRGVLHFDCWAFFFFFCQERVFETGIKRCEERSEGLRESDCDDEEKFRLWGHFGQVYIDNSGGANRAVLPSYLPRGVFDASICSVCSVLCGMRHS